jgi:hypothetical protein
MKKIAFPLLILGILLGLLLLVMSGVLRFGHGLGDLIYLVLISVASITQLILIGWRFKTGSNSLLPISSLFFMLFCVFIIYKASFG